MRKIAADPVNRKFTNVDDIKIVTIAFAHTFKQATFSTTGGSDIGKNNFFDLFQLL